MTDLPAGWARATLSDLLLRIEAGKSFICEPRPAETGEWGIIKVSAMTYGVFREEENKAVPAHQEIDPAHEIKPGNILISRASGTREYVGAPVLVGECRRHLLLSDKSLRLVPSSEVNIEWLLYMLASPLVRTQISAQASGTNSLRNISQQALSAIEIFVPPKDQQARIVAVLGGRLSMIEEATKPLQLIADRISVLRDHVTSRACTGKLLDPDAIDSPPSLEPAGVVDGQLPSLAPTWRWTRLGDIAEVVGGVTKDTKKQSDPSLPLVPYLRVANVQRGRLDLTDIAYIRVPESKARQLSLESGDVLLNEGGDRDKLGRGWIWEDQIPGCIHQNHVFRARIRDDILHPKLLAWHANGFGRSWFDWNAKQSVNLASISLSKIRMFPIPIPPPGSQQKLVAEAEALLALLEQAEESIRKALDQAASLRTQSLHDAAAGQLIPQDPSSEAAAVLLARIGNERKSQSSRRRRRGTSSNQERPTDAATRPSPSGESGAVTAIMPARPSVDISPVGEQESLFEKEGQLP